MGKMGMAALAEEFLMTNFGSMGQAVTILESGL